MSKLFRNITFLMAFVLCSCEYQPILERGIDYKSALIPVKVNWDNSGFEVDENGRATRQSNDRIHRVTFRFFPVDGGEIIERYIGDGYSVREGFIPVPVGKYRVIVMNESVNDTYWQGSASFGEESIEFENIDSFEDMQARVSTSRQRPSGYLFVLPAQYTSMHYMKPPLRLSTWSVSDFEVTDNMIYHTRFDTYTTELTDREKMMLKVLTNDHTEDPLTGEITIDEDDVDGIDMRPLTKTVRVSLQVKNLTSASNVLGGLIGFANVVNMRTAIGEFDPADENMMQYFTFNGRSDWYDELGNSKGEGWQPSSGQNAYEDYIGTTSRTFLTFGPRVWDETTSDKFALDIDFKFISGQNTEGEDTVNVAGAESALPLDVTAEVVDAIRNNKELLHAEVNIDIAIGTGDLDNSIVIEYHSGDIDVSDWDDETIIPLG